MNNTKIILKVTFKSGLPADELQAVTKADMPALEQVPGLIRKIYHVNEKTGEIGAVYHFNSSLSAETYLASQRISDMPDRYGIIPGSLTIEKVIVVHILEGKKQAEIPEPSGQMN